MMRFRKPGRSVIARWCAAFRGCVSSGKTIHEETRSGPGLVREASCDFVDRSYLSVKKTRNQTKTLPIAAFMILLAGLSVCAQKSSLRSSVSKIENPGALANFFKALSEANSGRRIEPVRVMHFGDSHVAADVLTAEIRQRLQGRFGDGGAGYIVPRNPMNTRRRGVLSG